MCNTVSHYLCMDSSDVKQTRPINNYYNLTEEKKTTASFYQSDHKHDNYLLNTESKN